MYTKSIKLNREDAIGIEEMIQHDPRIEKGRSEALYYAYRDVAEAIKAKLINWEDIKKAEFKDTPDIEIVFADTMTFAIEDNDFEVILASLRADLDITKVRISYMTRLCIKYARIKLQKKIVDEPMVKKIEVERIDGIAIIHNLTELLQSSNEQDKRKLKKIIEILED
ncbi:hypothetical protein [Clostridium tagluense]|uniref:hypothetical protein n=1 Tax=Clostridium tagluense TaxID=360422 RepID=UPI001CF1592B|nr:hypothetical protein [Clostridium tagluense]MCB2300581.1 hypothetical protein [Clostridium tagluense]